MEQQILEDVLAIFAQIAAIPRPSGHERRISDFLVAEFKKLGCKVIQDEVLNVIADLPATAGKEDAPLTILQGHMDMVCVADTGVTFNPLQDHVKLVRSEAFLQADGTSLGSDDGIGIAEILYVFSHLQEHGPLRAIITVDEEVGMLGAAHLAAEHLQKAKYLINCDSEDYDILTVGCAGSVNMDFSLPLTWQSVTDGQLWRLSVKGLRGGHSGEEIGNGRANAIKVLVDILAKLLKTDGFAGLSKINGGAARNAIPAEAQLEFVSSASAQELEELVAQCKAKFDRIFGAREDKAKFILQPLSQAQTVLSATQAEALVNLVALLHSGVLAMSPTLPELVETSANLGTIKTEAATIKLTYFPRSSLADKLADIVEHGRIIAGLTGFILQAAEPSPAWQEKSGSRLVKMMTDTFARQNGKTMTVNTIHAGLECGFHIVKNPELDMVSIGVTTHDIHSPRETLVLETVAPQVKLILSTLEQIAQEK